MSQDIVHSFFTDRLRARAQLAPGRRQDESRLDVFENARETSSVAASRHLLAAEIRNK